MSRLYGIIPPMVTPFAADGAIDCEAIARLLDFLRSYIHGLFVCGSYGLGPLMDVEERKLVAEEVLEHVPSHVKVVVHVGSTSTEDSADLAKHAEDIGAHAVASVPPYYYKHSPSSVLEHFKVLVSSVSIPVYVYNNPRTVGYPVTPDLMCKLRELGVQGVKDSSFDVLTFMRFREVCGEDFDIVVGTEALMLPTYVLGARAFIPGMSNYCPELVYELFQYLEQGDYSKAASAQYRVFKLRELVHGLGSPIAATYAILRLRGIDIGCPRKPFKIPSDEKMTEFKRKLAEYGLEEFFTK